MGTRIDQATKATALHERALAFGLNGETVDGVDVLAVKDAAPPHRRCRPHWQAGLPGHRTATGFFGHARKDKSPYRTEEEEAAGRKRDPVAFARSTLLEQGHSEDELGAVDDAAAAEMDATIDFTVGSDQPPLDSMFPRRLRARPAGARAGARAPRPHFSPASEP